MSLQSIFSIFARNLIEILQINNHMKRSLLFIAAVLIGSIAFSQSLSLSWTEGPIEPGSTIEVMGDPSDDLIRAEVVVTNNSTGALGIQAKKVINEGDTLPGTENTFCWGVCYPPFVYVGPVVVTIEAGASDDQFDGDYSPKGVPGKSTISYVFFVTDNPNDSVGFTVVYNASPLGLEDHAFSGSYVSDAYPNPAASKVSIDYVLPNDTYNATVTISNLLGAKVRSISLTGNTGRVEVPVFDFENGIYFYTVVAENRLIGTRKFVVRH